MLHRFDRAELELAQTDPAALGALIERSRGFALRAMLLEGLEPPLPLLLETLSPFSASYILERFPLDEALRERLQPLFSRALPSPESISAEHRETAPERIAPALDPRREAERALALGIPLREGTLLDAGQIARFRSELLEQSRLDDFSTSRILRASIASLSPDEVLALGRGFLLEHLEILQRDDLLDDPRLKALYRDALIERARSEGSEPDLSDFRRWPFLPEDRPLLESLLLARAGLSDPWRSGFLWPYSRLGELRGAQDLISPAEYAQRINPYDLESLSLSELEPLLPRIRSAWLAAAEKSGWSCLPDFSASPEAFALVADDAFILEALRRSVSRRYPRDFPQESLEARAKIRHLQTGALRACSALAASDPSAIPISAYSLARLAESLLTERESYSLAPEAFGALGEAFASLARAFCRTDHPEFAEFADSASRWADPRLLPAIGRLALESPSPNLFLALLRAREDLLSRESRRGARRPAASPLDPLLSELRSRIPLAAASALCERLGFPKPPELPSLLARLRALAPLLPAERAARALPDPIASAPGGDPLNLLSTPLSSFPSLRPDTRRLWLLSEAALPERLAAAGVPLSDEDLCWMIRERDPSLFRWADRALLARGPSYARDLPLTASSALSRPDILARAGLPDPEDAESRAQSARAQSAALRSLFAARAALRSALQGFSGDDPYPRPLFGERPQSPLAEAGLPEILSASAALAGAALEARSPEWAALARAALERSSSLRDSLRQSLRETLAPLSPARAAGLFRGALESADLAFAFELLRARRQPEMLEDLRRWGSSRPPQALLGLIADDFAARDLFALLLPDGYSREDSEPAPGFLDFGPEANLPLALALSRALPSESDPLRALLLFAPPARQALAFEAALALCPLSIFFHYRLRPSRGDRARDYLSPFSAEQALAAWDAAEALPGGILSGGDSNADLSSFWREHFEERPSEYLRLLELSRARPLLHLSLLEPDLSNAAVRGPNPEFLPRSRSDEIHCRFALERLDWGRALEGVAQIGERLAARELDPEARPANPRLAHALLDRMVWSTYWEESSGAGSYSIRSAFPRALSERILSSIVQSVPAYAYSLSSLGDLRPVSEHLGRHAGAFLPESSEEGILRLALPPASALSEAHSLSGRFLDYARDILGGCLAEAASSRPDECAFLLWLLRERRFADEELSWEARRAPRRFSSPEPSRMEDLLEVIAEDPLLLSALRAGALRSRLGSALSAPPAPARRRAL